MHTDSNSTLSRRQLDGTIAALAVPAVVSNVTVPLLGISDTAISGHLGIEAYLGAIAVGSMMINVITWLCGFLRMGTTGLTAVAFGSGDTDGQWRTLVRGIAIGLGLGCLAVVLQVPLCRLFLWQASPSPEVGQWATRYFAISVWGLPAVLLTLAVNGWFIGMQNTAWPMAIAITTNLLNIGLSLIFALWSGMGFTGVALGTLCANWLGATLALWAVGRRMRGNAVPPLRCLLGRGGWRRYFTVNVNLFFRSACVMAVSVAMTSTGARLGDTVLAVNAVMMQFFVFFSFVMDGLAFAGEALSGRFAGAGNRPMLLASVRRLLMWSAVMAVLFSTAYAVFGQPIIRLLTDLPQVVAEADRYRPWLIALPLLTVAAFILDGFYIGLLHTRRMLYATIVGMCIFAAIAFLHLTNGTLRLALPDNSVLWSAFLGWLVGRGLTLALLLPRTLSPQSTALLAKTDKPR